MLKTLTVSEARAKLGRLLDKAGKGQAVYLRRKKQLFRIEAVEESEPIPVRPIGYFDAKGDDPLTDLANAAPVSYPPHLPSGTVKLPFERSRKPVHKRT